MHVRTTPYKYLCTFLYLNHEQQLIVLILNDLELKYLREKSNLNKAEFCKALNISVHTLSSWESGRRNIPDVKALLIKETFTNVKSEIQSRAYQPEGKVIDVNNLPEKNVLVIPIKGRGGLDNAYYDDLLLNELKIEKLSIKNASEILRIFKENGITGYKIEKDLKVISQVGADKFLNGETKKPFKKTLELYNSYIDNNF